LAYLRRKLLNDLREAEKIFVWRQGITNLSDDALASLHEAMRQYGDNTLLYVRYRDDDRAHTEVNLAGPGLMIGHVDRFIWGRDGSVGPPVANTWTAVCRNAHELSRRRAAGHWVATDLSNARCVHDPDRCRRSDQCQDDMD